MNRLQKKCTLATAGVHLLLLLILLVGPGFFQPRPKTEQMHVLDMIPANVIDAVFDSGVRNARPPRPAPRPPAPQPRRVVTPHRVVAPPPPAPAPQPRPVVTHRPPAPAPKRVEKPEPVKPARHVVKPDLRRVERPARPEPHKIKVNLKPVVRGETGHSRNIRRESRRAEAVRSAIQNLRRNFSPSTTIDMPGNSSAAYANYAEVVKSVYQQAWVPPSHAANDEANTKVRVTIARDGTVISARIIEPSGDASVDASVRRTLERVQFIAPFPEGSTDKERTYIINFNLKAKRMFG